MKSFDCCTENVQSEHANQWNNNGDIPANIELFKGNNRNTRKRCEICLKLSIKKTRMMSPFWYF